MTGAVEVKLLCCANTEGVQEKGRQLSQEGDLKEWVFKLWFVEVRRKTSEQRNLHKER